MNQGLRMVSVKEGSSSTPAMEQFSYSTFKTFKVREWRKQAAEDDTPSNEADTIPEDHDYAKGDPPLGETNLVAYYEAEVWHLSYCWPRLS